jgi:hypothetical protein
MPETFDRVKQWSRVADGSTLEIVITGTTKDEAISASVDWLDSANNGKEEPVDTVSGKPTKLKLKSPRAYSVDVLVHFVTKATVTIDVRVVKPDGTTHGAPFDQTFTAPANANEFFSFFVFTSQG